MTRTEPFLVARLPLPPSVNHLYRTIPWTTRDGKQTARRVATAEYLAFQQEAIYRLRQAEVQDWTAIEEIQACRRKRKYIPLRMEMVCYVERWWKGDADNMIKAAQDTIFSFLSLNDNLVTDIIAKKRPSIDPHCQVRLFFANLEEGEDLW